MSVRLKEFVKEYTDIFALALGILIFHKFTDATNPAVQSFLWLTSSIMVICLLGYILVMAISFDTSIGVKLIIALPLFILNLSFTMQFMLNLFEPANKYSLFLLKAFWTKEFILSVLIVVVILIILLIIISLLVNRKKKLET